MTDLLRELAHERLLVIIRGTDPEAAIMAGRTLLDAGIRFLEVSLVTTDALRVISELARLAADDAVVGAGTVLTRVDVDRGIAVFAGALTPTEVVTAMDRGALAVKLFPAALGGPAYLSGLRDPLPDVPFVPVGGVDIALAADYLAAGAVAVGVGGPLVGDAARGGDLAALDARARAFLAVTRASYGSS